MFEKYRYIQRSLRVFEYPLLLKKDKWKKGASPSFKNKGVLEDLHVKWILSP